MVEGLLRPTVFLFEMCIGFIYLFRKMEILYIVSSIIHYR